MKTQKLPKCQNIINGKQCNIPVSHHFAKVCKPCAKEIRRIKNNEYYHANKKVWQPYTKNCKLESCNAIIKITDKQQSHRKYCDKKCSKKYHNQFNKKQSYKPHVSRDKKIHCVCPRCEAKHEISETELYWTGKLPARKNCENCRASLLHIDGLMAEGYVVGYY